MTRESDACLPRRRGQARFAGPNVAVQLSSRSATREHSPARSSLCRPHAFKESRVPAGGRPLALGLGIGANTAIFSLINAIMLRILPVTHPEQLKCCSPTPGSSGVAIDTTQHGVRSILAYPEFEQLRSHNQVFSGIFAAQSAPIEVDAVTAQGAGEQTAKARIQLVSGEFFRVLECSPS